jgi:hypothetical protein
LPIEEYNSIQEFIETFAAENNILPGMRWKQDLINQLETKAATWNGGVKDTTNYLKIEMMHYVNSNLENKEQRALMQNTSVVR